MRKSFVHVVLLLTMGVVLTACAAPTPAPAAPPQVVPQTSWYNRPSSPTDCRRAADRRRACDRCPPTAAPAAKQIVIYMQMGGTQGDPSTLARTNGAKAAAAVYGVKLVEQYSAGILRR